MFYLEHHKEDVKPNNRIFQLFFSFFVVSRKKNEDLKVKF